MSVRAYSAGPAAMIGQVIRELGIVETADNMVRWDPKHCKRSAGRHILVVLISVFMGRTLDKIFEAGPKKVFGAAALRAAIKDEASFIVHGCNRDHRPDLKQFNYGLVVNGEGIPLKTSRKELTWESNTSSRAIPSVHGSTVVRLYKMRWKVEEYHRSAKQDLGLGDYQGRKLRGIIAHLVSVALVHILVVFMKACLPRLNGASTGQLVHDFIRTPCRVNNSRAGLTVLFERPLPYSKAIRHYQMARVG